MDKEIVEEFRKYFRLKRTHASHFNWHDKKAKEAGIIDDFLNPLNHKGIHEFVSFTVPEQGPPDAIVFDHSNNEVYLELTELVNEKAIKAQIQNKNNYWEEAERWAQIEYFENQINAAVKIKAKKCSELFKSEREVHLLFHSDEMWIESTYKKYLRAGLNIEENEFKKIWLILSYSADSKSYPVVEIISNV